jgi:hypothetical protein
MSDAKEKLKALQLTIDKLEKTYGKGTIMKLSDERVPLVLVESHEDVSSKYTGLNHRVKQL